MKTKYILLIPLLISITMSLIQIESFDNFTLNLFFQIRGKRPISNHLLNVIIEDKDYFNYLKKNNLLSYKIDHNLLNEIHLFSKKFHNFFYWNTSFMIKLIEKLEKFEPDMIIFLPTFPSGGKNAQKASFHTLNDDHKKKLEELSKKIPVLWSSYLDTNDQILSPPPYLTNNIFFYSNIISEPDMTVRKINFMRNNFLSLPGALAEIEKFRNNFPFVKTQNLQSEKDLYINFSGSDGPKYTLSATAFLESIALGWENIIKNKIILIDINSEFSPKHLTPFGFPDTNAKISSIKIQNEILSSLIEKTAIKKISFFTISFISMLMGVTSIFLFIKFPILFSQLLIFLIGILFIFVSLILFSLNSIWVITTTPILTIFVTSIFMTFWKYVLEDREKIKRIHLEIDELKGNFLSLISHNLKTPIAKIRALSSVLLNKDSEKLNEHQVEAITNILKSSRDLTSYIANILNITRIDAQRVKLHKTVCDVNTIINQVVEKIKLLTNNKDIDFILNLEPIFSVELDKELFFQLFFNILENAVKYSPNYSTVTITSKEENQLLYISVTDKGIGISKEELTKVFEKFHRTKNIYTETITGTGLGLYLAKYFVELHKGEIKLDSTIGEGSTFTIILPIS